MRQVRFSFDESHLTHFGGMWLIQRFCNRLHLRQLLQRHIRSPRTGMQYHDSELILAILYVIIMGLRRINKTEILQYNGAFLEMLGLQRFPDQTTLRRFLKQLSPATIRKLVRLHDSLRRQLFTLPSGRSSMIFDLDSAVLVVYGHAAGARLGYNPKKRGRRSYHPLFCFEARRQEFWHGSLRPGNTISLTGAIPFVRACLAKVPATIACTRIRWRMDAGFYSSKLIRFLDGTGCGYVIVAKQYEHLKTQARRCRFRTIHYGWEVGEFQGYVRQNWKELHRFVVVRRPIPDDPEEAKQPTLFKDQKYIYHVFVTNLPMSPWRVYLFYRPRAAIEKQIRELVYDYPLGKIPTDNWLANVAYFHLVLFAANLVHWFKRLCLPTDYRGATLDTVRTDFLVVPALLVRRSGKNIVKLPHDYHYQREFLRAFETISSPLSRMDPSLLARMDPGGVGHLE